MRGTIVGQWQVDQHAERWIIFRYIETPAIADRPAGTKRQFHHEGGAIITFGLREMAEMKATRMNQVNR